MSKKNSYWQIIRGICILAVVMFHSPNAAGFGTGSIEFGSWIILRQLFDFPVAVFFFMSGYFVKPDTVEQSSKTYVLKRGGFISTVYSVVPVL